MISVRGASVDTADSSGFADARRAVSEADAVVLVLGEREDMSAEAASRASIELPGSQKDLALTVIRAARVSPGGENKPVVAVLMNGRPLAVPELAREAPALIESWFLGSQHGTDGRGGARRAIKDLMAPGFRRSHGTSWQIQVRASIGSSTDRTPPLAPAKARSI